MDSTSIITQASREEEQLASFPPERAFPVTKKPRHKGLLNTLLCCFGANANQHNPPICSEENGQYSPKCSLFSTCHLKKRWKQSCIKRQDSQDIESNRTYEDVDDDDLEAFGIRGMRKCLLPQLRHQDVHKMCMVIDLDETLVHSSFKPISNADFIVPVEIDGTVHQVYVLKRPYVEEFLQKMGELYECVLFTASLAKYADPVADLLDKWGVFRARLFRESCVFYRGNYVKDLGRLGRELHKVVIVDNSPASYIFHPDNAVPVASWFDDMSDTELRDLIPFFEKLSKVDNVYTVLRNSNHAAGSHPVTPPCLANGPQVNSLAHHQQLNGSMQPS